MGSRAHSHSQDQDGLATIAPNYMNAHSECVRELNAVMAERDALAAKVEQLRGFALFVKSGLARGNIKSKPIISMPRGAKEWPMETLEEIADKVLVDAPPPAVVPAADVEPLLEAMRELIEHLDAWGPSPADGWTIDGAQKAFAAYRLKHPASVPPGALGAGES